MVETWNVTDHGAVADGRTPCTQAIARAIGTCSRSGGGTVRFPPGIYLTGPIQLASHVDLRVDVGASVVFSRDFDDYPMVPIRWQGYDGASCMPLIYGRGLRNIAITGGGTFDGSGDAWRPVKKGKMTPEQWAAQVRSGGIVDEARGIWWPTRAAMEGERAVERLWEGGGPLRPVDLAPHRDFLRPVLVGLHECHEVRLEGPTFRNPPCWTIHPLMCENVTVRDVKVRNPWHAANGDGLNPDSCRHVLIEDCFFSTGDDCIALNAGRDPRNPGARPCEDVVIRNCRMERGHGGVVIGSSMSGDVRRVHVHDCTFDGTDIGLRFKSRPGRGGVVEDVRVHDITMSSIRDEAIRFNLRYQLPDSETIPASGPLPRFRDFHISRVRCRQARIAIWMRGLADQPIENVSFEDVHVVAERGIEIEHVDGIALRRVHVRTERGPGLQYRQVANLSLDRFTHGP